VASVGCGSGELPEEPAPVVSTQIEQEPTPQVLRDPPGQGQYRPEDPYWKKLFRARSSDGLAWTALPEPLAAQASSPQLVLVHGEPRVWFVSGGRSLAWVPFAGGDPQPVEIEGIGEGMQVDPHLLALPQGGHRLYFLYQELLRDPAQGVENQVLSARSPDGAGWIAEPGVRLAGSFVDPDLVVLAEGGVRMYLTRDAREIKSASSADGLSFELEQGTRMVGGGVTSTLLVDDEWWMYFQDGGSLGLARSTDGLEFGSATPVAVQGASHDGVALLESPTVLRHGDQWLMVYAVAVPPGADDLPPASAEPGS